MGAFVQSPAALDTSGASASFAAITATAGNLLVVGVRLGGNVTVTISDDKGNSWALVDGQQNNSDGDSIYIYQAQNNAGGSTTVTITPSSSVSIRGSLFELSGLHVTSPVDQHSHQEQTGTNPSSSSITSTAKGMWIGFLSVDTGFSALSAGTLGSATATLPAGGVSSKHAMEYHNESGTLTGSAAFNNNLSNNNWIGVVNFRDADVTLPTKVGSMLAMFQ